MQPTKKFSQLPPDSTPTIDDYIATTDATSSQSRKVLLSDLLTLFFTQTAIPAGGGSPVTRHNETMFDFVASGGVWAGDSYGVNRAASMSAMICYINGYRISIAAVSARTFTASKDTYIDVLSNQDGTGTLVYTEVVNNAASPALASNSIRIGIIVTGATTIAAVGSVNQGQETKVLPIASSIAYSVTDSLGNLICCRDSARKTLGYRQIVATFVAGAGTLVDVTGLNSAAVIPTARKITVKFWAPQIYSSIDGDRQDFKLYEDGVEIQASYNRTWSAANGGNGGYIVERVYTPATAGAHTYKVGVIRGAGTGVANVFAAATNPASVKITLD